MSNAHTHGGANRLWCVGGVPWALPEPLTSAGRAAGYRGAKSTGIVTAEPWQDWMLGFLLAFFGLLVAANILIPAPQGIWVQSLIQVPMRGASYAGLVAGALAVALGAYFGMRKRLPILSRGMAFGITMSMLVQVALLIYWYSLP